MIRHVAASPPPPGMELIFEVKRSLPKSVPAIWPTSQRLDWSKRKEVRPLHWVIGLSFAAYWAIQVSRIIRWRSAVYDRRTYCSTTVVR